MTSRVGLDERAVRPRMNFAKMGSAPEKKQVAPARVSWNGHGKAGALAKEVVVVAINASKGVTEHALEWALKNVVQPGDSIFLLVLLPPVSPGWRFWQVSHTDSVTKDRKRLQETKKSCQVVLEKLHSLSGAKKVHATVRIIPGAVKGVASKEAKNLSATWVLLDRSLKNEERACSEELQCNLVIVKRQNAKILRLNLKQSPPPKTINWADSKFFQTAVEREATPSGSPDVEALFTPTDNGTPTSSSTSPFSSAEPNNLTVSTHNNPFLAPESGVITESDTDDSSCGRTSRRSNCVDYGKQGKERSSKQLSSTITRLSLSMREGGSHQSPQTSLKSATATSGLSPRLILSDFLTSLRRMDSKKQETRRGLLNVQESMQTRDHTSVRTAVSLSSHAPLGPPPLCSICQHKAPAFGRPPRAFTYEELERATAGFSQANFLAEGGFGSVHRGVLPEGQVVAVKQHKLASSQGDVEFCSEVEVLSCAQHRNVVMLIGYCIEDSRRLLVYEYICNGSLDSHLYGRGKAPLEWRHRRKIAVGAARGLRYLHEECRVGCIVHRDLRPNNVLLTHDYEPMVGDFGLARWQPDGELGVETRVIGTFGYLAPEYTQSGQITEKADVYSFGVVLLELVTGRKAIDITRPKGQQCLTEWARLLLRKGASYNELVDPWLEGCYDSDELEFMVHAASLCISRDPDTRPRMSQVLRMLEGDLALGERSGRLSFDAGSSIRATTSSVRQTERRSVSAAGTRSSNRLCSKSSSSSSAVAAMSSGRSLTLEELKAAYRSRMQSRKLWYDGHV